jgi:hypothetical protein
MGRSQHKRIRRSLPGLLRYQSGRRMAGTVERNTNPIDNKLFRNGSTIIT